MYEAPDIDPGAIADALSRDYGLAASAVTYLALGHDSAAWAYRAETGDGAVYFVKLRRLPLDAAVALVPRMLDRRGATGILAPVPTRDGAPYATIGEYGVVVQPFVGGHTGMEQPLTKEQWVAFGAAARRIHDTALDAPVVETVPRETFRPKWDGVIRAWADARDLDERIASERPADEIGAATQQLWRRNRDEIRAVVDRAEALGTVALATRGERVVCHADLHTGNVIIDARGGLRIVDWDEVVIAPRERDLMFVVGGGISRDLVPPEAEHAFLAGYGAVDVDRTALGYYKHAWAVQDIAGYGGVAFARGDLAFGTRREALRILRTLFAPGEIVELAGATLV